jgi:hypothetical protein
VDQKPTDGNVFLSGFIVNDANYIPDQEDDEEPPKKDIQK